MDEQSGETEEEEVIGEVVGESELEELELCCFHGVLLQLTHVYIIAILL